nr:Chain P, Flap endonuclease 1 [Thermochaetoides thermophila DSM 1495]
GAQQARIEGFFKVIP